jgi:Family of unknown function (DUF6529)
MSFDPTGRRPGPTRRIPAPPGGRAGLAGRPPGPQLYRDSEPTQRVPVQSSHVSGPPREVGNASAGLFSAVVLGGASAVGLGVFAKLHEPRFYAINLAGFSSGTSVKAWLATIALLLAVLQLCSAFVMYGLVPRIKTPRWIGTVHVWSGRAAVLVTVPVAVHCLYALGFQSYDSRVLAHSILGCFFYGAFVTKMLVLTRQGVQAWVVPIVGGLVFFSLVFIWLASALWFFQTKGVTF